MPGYRVFRKTNPGRLSAVYEYVGEYEDLQEVLAAVLNDEIVGGHFRALRVRRKPHSQPGITETPTDDPTAP
jgi:hypothetical protein